MVNIDQEQLAGRIREQNTFITEEDARVYAQKLIAELDPVFESLLDAWIHGVRLPNVEVGPYSVQDIMNIRHSSDFLKALQMLNMYKLDPDEGENAIWSPVRDRLW